MSKASEYLFLNLGEAQAAEISQTIANKTAQKILEQLKSGAATESDLSAKLGIPLSTTHYNVQQLVKSGLVVGDQYHYSQKGREVSHYRLTNKLIVIVPQRNAQFDALVKALIPAVLVVAAGTGFVSYMASKFTSTANSAALFATDIAVESAPMMAKSAIIAPTADEAIAAASMIASDIAASEAAPETVMALSAPAPDAFATSVAPAVASEPHYALLFLIGGLVLIGASLLGMWLWQKARQ